MTRSGNRFTGRALNAGTAEGELVVLEAPLSFWGGMDPKSGHIIDRRHPQWGEALGEKIIAMPTGRGSSSSSSVLAEAIWLGTAPAGLILREPDGIIALGAIVAAELYGRWCPVVCIAPRHYAMLRSGLWVRIAASHERGTIRVTTAQPGDGHGRRP
jgi:predicted aconitase with swiveling domain